VTSGLSVFQVLETILRNGGECLKPHAFLKAPIQLRAGVIIEHEA